MKSKYEKKSYIQVICFGAIIGLITELLNFCIAYRVWKDFLVSVR